MEQNLYIINVVTLERLTVQFIPQELSYTSNAELAEVKIVARNEPKYQYTGGQTTLPLVLEFVAEDTNREDVIRKVRWLEALRMTNGYLTNPPRVKIVFGRIFRDELWTVKSVKPRFSLFNPAISMLPNQASVAIDFVLDPSYNTRWRDVLWPAIKP